MVNSTPWRWAHLGGLVLPVGVDPQEGDTLGAVLFGQLVQSRAIQLDHGAIGTQEDNDDHFAVGVIRKLVFEPAIVTQREIRDLLTDARVWFLCRLFSGPCVCGECARSERKDASRDCASPLHRSPVLRKNLSFSSCSLRIVRGWTVSYLCIGFYPPGRDSVSSRSREETLKKIARRTGILKETRQFAQLSLGRTP